MLRSNRLIIFVDRDALQAFSRVISSMAWAAQLNPRQRTPMAQAAIGVNPKSMKTELAPPMTFVQTFFPLILSKAF